MSDSSGRTETDSDAGGDDGTALTTTHASSSTEPGGASHSPSGAISNQTYVQSSTGRSNGTGEEWVELPDNFCFPAASNESVVAHRPVNADAPTKLQNSISYLYPNCWPAACGGRSCMVPFAAPLSNPRRRGQRIVQNRTTQVPVLSGKRTRDETRTRCLQVPLGYKATNKVSTTSTTRNTRAPQTLDLLELPNTIYNTPEGSHQPILPVPGPSGWADDDSSKKKTCNCTKKQCLSGYCDCFKHSVVCSTACGCCKTKCKNTEEHSVEREAARQTALAKNPNAFNIPALLKEGCNCPRGCRQNYCPCRKADQECGSKCRCGPSGCQNAGPDRASKRARISQLSVVDQNALGPHPGNFRY